MSTKTKMGNLQVAIESSSGKKAVAVAPVDAPAPAPMGRPPGRAALVNISAWLPKPFKKHIRMVQVRRGDEGNFTLQDLMAEALNDLFVKYDVATVAPEE